MAKTEYYRQCSLKNGNLSTVSHLPEEFAIVGKKLKLKNHDIWECGWEVIGVGELVKAEFAEAKAHAYQDIWKPSTNISSRGNK